MFKTPMYKTPMNMQIVKAHNLHTTLSAVGAPLLCTVRLSELFDASAFIRAKLLHERVTIQSISVQFTVKPEYAAKPPAFALSYLSRDDESDVVDVTHYLKHPSVLKHDLTNGTCSRSMGAKELGTIATSPMICKQIVKVTHTATTMGSLNGQSASIKIIVPTDQLTQNFNGAAQAGLYSITCYTTYVCKFIGQEDTLSTAEANQLSQSFS